MKTASLAHQNLAAYCEQRAAHFAAKGDEAKAADHLRLAAHWHKLANS